MYASTPPTTQGHIADDRFGETYSSIDEVDCRD